MFVILLMVKLLVLMEAMMLPFGTFRGTRLPATPADTAAVARRDLNSRWHL